MTLAPPLPVAPSPPRARRASDFWPVLVWMALQALALVAAALRVPFSARFPAPAEQLAIHEMLFVQTVASALLFPVLFRSLTVGVLVIATAPLMLQLAAVLSAESDMAKLVGACVYSGMWLIGLGLFASALRTSKAQLYGVATALLVVLGGAVVTYLRREFGSPSQTFEWAPYGCLGPLVGGVTILEAGERAGTVWYFMGGFVVLGLIAAGARWMGSRPPA